MISQIAHDVFVHSEIASPFSNIFVDLFFSETAGPCNMHTADLVGKNNLFVFRGGDGRAYLNASWSDQTTKTTSLVAFLYSPVI